jgi:DHA2 family multidrug resistance protein-like MFS transporter
MSSAKAGNGATNTNGGNGAPSALAGPREWAALAVLVLPVVLISVDMTVLGFAVPALSEALSPTSGQLLWIIDIYGFILAGLLITMGSLGDRIGRRRLLMIGSAAFGLASLLAAFSPNAETLILARALLGVAGASLMPSTLSLLRNIFLDPRQRLLAIAIWASGFSAGAALGPILGGWLLEHFFWGSVFLINLPVMALILILVPLLVRESRNPDSGRIDILSVLLSLGAMLPAVYGVKKMATGGIDVLPILSLAFGLTLGYLFVRRQRRLRDPLIDVGLFRSRVFSVAVLTNLMIVFSMVGSLFFLTQYLQLVLGVSPMRAGLVLVPGLVLSVVASLVAARLARHLSLAAIIGGIGSLPGAMAGAALVVLVRDYLGTDLGGRGPLLVGVMFVAVVYLMPRGIAGLVLRLLPPPRLRVRVHPSQGGVATALRPGRLGAVLRPARAGGPRGLRCDAHVLLHARAQGRGAASHEPAEGREGVRGLLRADDEAICDVIARAKHETTNVSSRWSDSD